MKSRISKLVILAVAGLLVGLGAVPAYAGTTGIISGVVKNAKGAPVSGANVIITGTGLTAVTDAKGYFAITDVPPGEYEVRAQMVGFATQSFNPVQVSMDTTTTVNFEMKKQAIQETTVTVTRPRLPKPMLNPGIAETLNQFDGSQEPLTRTDPTSFHSIPTLLTTLPGVIMDPGGTGQVHFRGGRTDDIGYYIEGVPITDPNVGQFSTNLFSTGVSKFQMYAGGFGAEYGNAISGVLNEVKKTGSQDPGMGLNMEGGGQAYASAFLQAGAGSPDGFNYYIGSVLQHDNIDGSPNYTSQAYSDNTVNLVWPDQNNKFSLLALQGDYTAYADAYHDVGDNGLPTPHEKDYDQQKYTVDAFTWSHNFGSDSFVSLQPYYIWDSTVLNLSGTYQGEVPYAYENAWASQKGFQLQYTNQINPMHLVKVGSSLLSSTNRFYVNMPIAGYPIYQYHSDTDTSQMAFYAQDNVKLARKWSLQAGLRDEGIKYFRDGPLYDSNTQTYGSAPAGPAQEWDLEPRTGLSYSPDPRTAIKFDWGKYCKFMPAYNVQKIYFDPTAETIQTGLGPTAPETSTQYEFSFEKQFTRSASLRITPFWASYSNLIQAYTDPNTGLIEYTNLGLGKSKGIEMLLRKRMSDHWQGWLSYTYMTTKANSSGQSDQLASASSNMYYASWDQRHTVSLVTSYQSRRMTHTLRVDFGSGRADIIAPGVAGQGRASANIILSYDLSFKLPKGSSLGKSVDLSIYNILDSRQVLQYQVGGDGSRTPAGWVPARTISLGLNKSF